ncbi:hypothetical protein GMD78_06130 [Ornithinibacillus sp. L9]|uniref:Uncharacterized protein n=1 Tax=Ornithinibacillus caprae TaxID=2678566 RepID=A0A6N8FEX0_9BACI|nr:hypothetical protein [Ornithinibacillus caprae]MUK87975.1 hypothetical protein [Ornithinibacillus caprae]
MSGGMLIISLVIIFAVYWVVKGPRGTIRLDLDDRYTNQKEHGLAVQEELTKRGKEATYLGKSEIEIDGETYFLQEQTWPSYGPPVQHTLLKKVKKNKQ